MTTIGKTNRLETFLSNDRALLICFWIGLVLVVSFAKEKYHLHFYEVVITLNKMLLLLVTNYYFFPKFYKKDKIVRFMVAIGIGIFFFGYIEELFIEPYLDLDPESHPVASPGVIFVSYGIPVAIFTGIKLMLHFRDKQQLIDRLEREKSEGQLKFLKSQINPHILFNNLNNIYSLSMQGDRRTPDTVLKLANLMRYVIYESAENHVLLSKELEYLGDYLELQKIQLEGRGTVGLVIKGDPQGYVIAPLLLIPFVENSFKHSMDTQLDDISIDLGIDITDGVLTFEGSNTHRAEAKDGRTPKGIGLDNTKQRLQLLYPERHELTITREDRVFNVRLTVKLI